MLSSFVVQHDDIIHAFTPKKKKEKVEFSIYDLGVTIVNDMKYFEKISFISFTDENNFYGRVRVLFHSNDNIVIFTKYDLFQYNPEHKNILQEIEKIRLQENFPKENMFMISLLDKEAVRRTISYILLELIHPNTQGINLFNKGVLYEQGIIYPRDIELAISYYEKSEDKRGYKRISNLYKKGKYIEQDLNKAIEFCEKSGDKDEASLLKILYIKKLSKFKYEIIKIIDSGSFGKIYLAKNLEKENVVLKTIYCDDSTQMNKGLKEFQYVTKLKHENIVQMNKVFIDSDGGDSLKVVIEMKYYPDGTLYNYILNQDKLSNEMIVKLAIQLLNGLEYIHSNNIVHRDMKPQNVLIEKSDKDIRLLISDFGESKYNQFSMRSTVGTPEYMAIEVIRGDKYDSSVDQFSFGGILLFMLTKESFKLFMEVIKNGWKDKLKHLIQEHKYPLEYANIIYSCTLINSKDRPNITEIKDQLQKIL